MSKTVYLLVSEVASIYLIWSSGKYESPVLFLLLSIISTISVIAIFFNEKRPFTLYKIFNIFTLFFMGIAPALQYKVGVKLYGVDDIGESDYINGAIYFLIAYFIFSISYFWSQENKTKKVLILNSYNKTPINDRLKKGDLIKMVLVSLCLFIYVFYYCKFNVYLLMFRGMSEELAVLVDTTRDVSQMQWLLTEYFIRPINSFIAVTFYLLYGHRHKITAYLLFIIAFFTMAPTAVARFSAAAVYLPVSMALFPFLRKGHNLAIAMVLGLLVVWPFLDLFRYFSTDVSYSLDSSSVFTSENMDSFSSLARVLKYDVVTYGKQLLGVLFFWLPRSVWPNKPIGSGAMMARDHNYVFDNISCNYFAEGYINFGFWGILLFAIILGVISSRLDNSYWCGKIDIRNSYTTMYFMTIGLMFFILRGDGLSSFSSACGFFLSLSASTLFLKLKNNNHVKASSN